MPGHPYERLSYDGDYDQALSYLYGLQKFGIKFGLSNTENLLKAFNHPEQSLSLIHIAGSNGKGSVAAMLASIYARAGYRIGLFTSPHLVDFRERFRINGEMISKAMTLELIREIRERTDPAEPPTFFEFVTALALIYFHREKVDLAVMEVGLGGRLDATNIIHPLVTVITNISLEHQDYLGKTLKKIALEKAGIIKDKVPLVTGVRQKGVRETIGKVCLEKAAPMLLAGRDFKTLKTGPGRFTYFSSEWKGPGVDRSPGPSRRLRNLDVNLPGDHQIGNAGLALTVTEIIKDRFSVQEEAVRQGLHQVQWPGRMEVLARNPLIVLDGAHNPGAMRTLSQSLPGALFYKRLLLVFGMMKDKDIGKTFQYILPLAQTLYLTRAEYDRSADPAQLVPYAEKAKKSYQLFPTIPEAIRRAQAEAKPEDLILITGSLFIVGEARAWWERERRDD